MSGADVRVEFSSSPLPVAELVEWATRPDCGAVVTFLGVARDHSEGRPGVTSLEYEAYQPYALDQLSEVAREARRRWSEVGAVALVHREGRLDVGEAAVVVVVSAPHRDAAFAAAQFCIDTLKAVVPIWKRETWAGGSDWGADSQELRDLQALEGQPAAGPGGT